MLGLAERYGSGLSRAEFVLGTEDIELRPAGAEITQALTKIPASHTGFHIDPEEHPFCGVSGGIGPDNVTDLLTMNIAVDTGLLFWIDMESSVRSRGSFDLQKCEAVCREVYG